MRLQLLSLLLGATILTTNPLFAMLDKEEDKEEKSTTVMVPHKCPTCTPLEFPINNEKLDQGMGRLRHIFNIDKNTLIGIIGQDPRTTRNVSCTSKTMNIMCGHSTIWQSFSRSNFVHLNPELCVQEQFKKYYSVFLNPSRAIKESDILRPYYSGECFTPARKPGETERLQNIPHITHALGNVLNFCDYYDYIEIQPIFEDEYEMIISFSDRENYDPEIYEIKPIKNNAQLPNLASVRKKTEFVRVTVHNERKTTAESMLQLVRQGQKFKQRIDPLLLEVMTPEEQAEINTATVLPEAVNNQ